MSKSKNKSSNVLMQGSILAMASLISRVIGLLYRVPMKRIIGNTGNNYYGTAFEIYNILLIISSFSLPLAVSKLVAARVKVGEKKNAYQIFKGAMVFALCSGLIASLIVFFGADFLAKLMKTDNCKYALRVLGPCLIIVAVLGVIRGFFQGMGTMVPSAISQVLEQIVNAIVSIVAASYLVNVGMKISRIICDDNDMAAAYGAAGGTFGTLAGAIFGLIFLLFVLFLYLKVFKKQMLRDRSTDTESFKYTMYILIITIIPVLLSTTIYNINGLIDNGIYKKVALLQGYDKKLVGDWYGCFTGQYKVLINLPISISSALAASCVPALSAAFAVKDMDEVKKQINVAMRFIMVVACPCAMGLAVLARPILCIIFKADEYTDVTTNMMVLGAISVIFFAISTLSNGILQGIDRMKIPVRNACIALVSHLFVLIGLMVFFRLDIYAVVIANAFFGLVMCITNAYSVKKYSGYQQEIVKTYIIPVSCSLIMGIVTFVVYKLLYMVTHIMILAFLVAFVFAVITYSVSLLLLKGLEEEEILRFPMGARIVKVTKKLHLLK